MRLSESLRRNIMEANVGGVVNRFKIRKRRVTLFFGDIFMRYIEECEGSGHKKEMKSIAEEWMLHYFKVLVPGSLKSLPLFLLNAVMRKVWINLGLMDDFRIVRKGDVMEIHT
ncbi:MAG: hypothetical protein KAT35_04265, partial [Candidatus Aenigmarchaeota archaeon]|nr:hypothetical protein [Candidatus Aenigmarchaeota archaeon]